MYVHLNWLSWDVACTTATVPALLLLALHWSNDMPASAVVPSAASLHRACLSKQFESVTKCITVQCQSQEAFKVLQRLLAILDALK